MTAAWGAEGLKRAKPHTRRKLALFTFADVYVVLRLMFLIAIAVHLIERYYSQ